MENLNKIPKFMLGDDVQEVFDDHAAQLATIQKVLSTKTYQNIITKMIKGEPVTIVCYGDSITFGYIPGSGDQTANPYPAVLQAILRDFYNNDNITVINEGYSGRQSDEFASDAYINNVKIHNPDLGIFMCGINDKNGNSYGGVTAIMDYVANLDIVQKKLDIPMIFLTPTPTFGGVGTSTVTDEDKKDRLETYVEAMKAYGSQKGFKVIDLNRGVYNYYYNRIIDIRTASPDIVHYADNFYKHIAEYIFAFGLTNTDIVVNDKKFYPAIHSIYNFLDTAPKYYESSANPEIWNVLLQSTGISSCFSYVFIDKSSADFVLNCASNVNGSGKNIVTIDGQDYVVSGYSKSTFWNVRKLIKNLEYGLHKIVFKAIDDTSSSRGVNFMFNGMEFIPKDYRRPTVTQSQNNVFETKRKDVLFDGMKRFSIATTPSTGWAYEKFLDVSDNQNKHLRIYAELGNYSAIGFGSYQVRKDASNLVEAPVYVLFQGGTTNYFSIVSLPLSTDSAFTDVYSGATTIKESTLPKLTQQTMCIIDVVSDGTKVDFYVNESFVASVTQAETIIGNLGLSIFGYSPSLTKILKVEELTNVAVGEYFEGDEYYDTVSKSKKIYDGTDFT